MDWLAYEKEAQEKGFRAVCGVDEAGRGPLAGPVCAAAVILPLGLEIPGVNDSKKLTEKKREALFPVIQEKALSWCVAWASCEEIDELNILNATYLAMERAVEGLKPPADFALIDGNRLPPQLPVPAKTIVKGDSLSMSIACASILAKVSRDRQMLLWDETYPQYQFAKHKGYGTKLHTDLLRQYGPCPIHRKSFLKKILGTEASKQTPKDQGARGEAAAAVYLEKNGFQILERNYRSPYGEIDIIAQNGQYIIFVEVKTRKSGAMVTGAEAVDSLKQKKLSQTALCYLMEHPGTLQPRFDVIQVIPTGEDRCRISHLPGAFEWRKEYEAF